MSGTMDHPQFGTSGLRGLVTDLVGELSRRWTMAFLHHAATRTVERILLVGQDLRSSSPRIASDCMEAAEMQGWRAIDCGALPTPALALEALRINAAAIMITGSHIPDDRNGLKFYVPSEITKLDEEYIRAAFDELPVALPQPLTTAPARQMCQRAAIDAYSARYTSAFAADALAGLTVGVYQQSSVARDVLPEILTAIGAVVVPLARADRFLPLDTEAHRTEDLALLAEWCASGRYSAIVSTDGDADRPLLSDETGSVVRGDLLGLLTAKYLSFATIVTPVTSSAAVETSGVGNIIIRTRVGSPYVIAGMNQAINSGAQDVVGFEANGGVLLGNPAHLTNGILASLPTRDAVLPILCALALAVEHGNSVVRAVTTLGAGVAHADRLKNVQAEQSGRFLSRLANEPAFATSFLAPIGAIDTQDQLDGVRFLLADGAIIHFRASGNAPELRVYVEAQSDTRASQLLQWGLEASQQEIGVKKFYPPS